MQNSKYHIITSIVLTILLTSCHSLLDKPVSMEITALANGTCYMPGDTVTVNEGEQVTFRFSESPDFVTFFSGEPDHEYKFRTRTRLSVNDLASCTLTFGLAIRKNYPDLAEIHVYISDEFEGLSGSDFISDSTMVEKHLKEGKWIDLVAPEDLPKERQDNTYTYYEIDLSDYLNVNPVLAFYYKGLPRMVNGVPQDKGQPGLAIGSFYLTLTQKNGKTFTKYPKEMGFLPLNMKNRLNYADQEGALIDKAYGSASGWVPGLWDLRSWNTGKAGSAYLHNSAVNSGWKYEWLISEPLILDTCLPDTGISIKGYTETLNSYSYTYPTAGIYTSTFIGKNINMDACHEKIQPVIVKVVKP